METVSLAISIVAVLTSVIALWASYFRKARPHFACSKWTAIRMVRADGKPRAAFSVHVSVVNNGKVPLEIKDLMLVAKTEKEGRILYEPIFLWDLRQWVEDGAGVDKIRRTQKGQVPLPTLIPPDSLYDFGYSILFLPVDKEKLVDPLKHSTVQLTLYALTDRERKYIAVGKQMMTDQDLKPLRDGPFSGAISTVSKARRDLLQSTLKRSVT